MRIFFKLHIRIARNTFISFQNQVTIISSYYKRERDVFRILNLLMCMCEEFIIGTPPFGTHNTFVHTSIDLGTH